MNTSKNSNQFVNTSQGIHVVAMPIGPVCNLNCEYCFYLEKQVFFGPGVQYRMSDEVLASFITSYIPSQPTPVVEFVWEGEISQTPFSKTDYEESKLHYLCTGYKKLFLDIRKYLRAMTQLLENNLPASYIMEAVKGPLVIRQRQ